MKTENQKLVDAIICEVKSNRRLYKSFDFSNVRQKFDLSAYLTDILYVLKTGISWRDLKSVINWNSVYKVYCKLVRFNILEKSYNSLLSQYLSKSKQSKLNCILTDTTFINNKNGSELIGYNTFYSRKKGTKISLITDSKGIPIDVKCYKGNMYDSNILEDQLETIGNSPIGDNHNTQYKKHFLADAGYDSNKIREKLKSLGYTPLIARNKRNNRRKIPKMAKKDKKVFKKRIKVEHTFGKIKSNKRILNRYDKKIANFIGFVYLALIKILC